MIEIGNFGTPGPGLRQAVMLHSTESGQFLACDRTEFDRLVAAAKRGDLDAFLCGGVTSVVCDGPPE